MGRRSRVGRLCRVCGLTVAESPGEAFRGGLCVPCRQEAVRRRRRQAGERLLRAGKSAGVEIRDGREYVVVVLPGRRSRSRSP